MGRSASKEVYVPPQYLKPQNVIYQTHEWDNRTLKKMIQTRKLSPFYPPLEIKADDNDECPICMMCYVGGLNRSSCCQQPICSECYLQVRKNQKDYLSECPFCKNKPYNVYYKGPKSQEEKFNEELEEQKVIELKMKMKIEQDKKDAEERERRSKMPEEAPVHQFILPPQPRPAPTHYAPPRVTHEQEEQNLQAFYERMFYPVQPPQRPAQHGGHHQTQSMMQQFQEYQQQRQREYIHNRGMPQPRSQVIINAPRPPTIVQRQPPPPRIVQQPPAERRLPPPPQIQQRPAPPQMQQYVPQNIGGVQVSDDVDYEDVMIREAIRLSLLEEKEVRQPVEPPRNINIINNNNIIINSDNLDQLIVTELLRGQRPVVRHDDVEINWEGAVDHAPTPPQNFLNNTRRESAVVPQPVEEEEDEELKAAIALSLVIQ